MHLVDAFIESYFQVGEESLGVPPGNPSQDSLLFAYKAGVLTVSCFLSPQIKTTTVFYHSQKVAGISSL